MRIECWHHRRSDSHRNRYAVLLNDVQRRKQHGYAANLLPETTRHLEQQRITISQPNVSFSNNRHELDKAIPIDIAIGDSEGSAALMMTLPLPHDVIRSSLLLQFLIVETQAEIAEWTGLNMVQNIL